MTWIFAHIQTMNEQLPLLSTVWILIFFNKEGTDFLSSEIEADWYELINRWPIYSIKPISYCYVFFYLLLLSLLFGNDNNNNKNETWKTKLLNLNEHVINKPRKRRILISLKIKYLNYLGVFSSKCTLLCTNYFKWPCPQI